MLKLDFYSPDAVIWQVNGLTGESYTFPQARDAIWRVASGLARHGVRQNDIVMVVSENCVEYVLTFHAVLSLGATVTMANPIYLTSKCCRCVCNLLI